MTNQEAIQIKRTEKRLIERRGVLCRIAATFNCVGNLDVATMIADAGLATNVTHSEVKAMIDAITKEVTSQPRLTMQQFLAVKDLV